MAPAQEIIERTVRNDPACSAIPDDQSDRDTPVADGCANPAGGTDDRTGQIEIVDSLSGNDQFDLEIGRFDIYEVALEKGDLLKVDLHSARFPAYLILVAPNDDVEIYEPQQNTASGSLLRLDIKIAATGSWLVGVLGENRDRGAYKLTCRWARANSQAPPPDTAMCTQLAFIIAHQETDYIFMRAGTEAATAKSFQPTVTPGHAL